MSRLCHGTISCSSPTYIIHYSGRNKNCEIKIFRNNFTTILATGMAVGPCYQPKTNYFWARVNFKNYISFYDRCLVQRKISLYDERSFKILEECSSRFQTSLAIFF